MKNTKLKLAMMATGALILSGCAAVLPSPKTVETNSGATVQLTYQAPSDAQQCTEVSKVSFNPNYKTYFGFIHTGPSAYDAIKLSDDYFVAQAEKAGANYINRDTVSESGFMGMYNSSNDIDAVLFNCANLEAQASE
ncbi:hypothetical protein [Vibrio gallicus]|uniref:hypothetical protein n=1 Tax=Vibrio gallicus TaxID=190897 RepID=UPI0021C25BD1|nr:hypothetical protein [Vibrio gallicus]